MSPVCTPVSGEGNRVLPSPLGVQTGDEGVWEKCWEWRLLTKRRDSSGGVQNFEKPCIRMHVLYVFAVFCYPFLCGIDA